MKAVLQLTWLYFTGALVQRVLTVLGLLAIGIGLAGLTGADPLVAQHGLRSSHSLGQEAIVVFLPVAGVLCLFFGSTLLPTTFARFATGRHFYTLPHARLRLLASAFATTLLVSLVSSSVVLGYYFLLPIPPATVFARSFSVALLFYTLLYVIVWLVGRSRTPLGLLGGTLVVIASLTVPLRFIGNPETALRWPWVATTILWTLFTAGAVYAPRLREAAARLRPRDTLELGGTYIGGREVDLFVGTARPWLLAVGQLFPIAVATLFVLPPTVWLFLLTIFSAIAGTIASTAAARARALWLRTHWTRVELFTRIESAYWHHNSYALGVLLVALVVVGSYLGMTNRALALGLGLLSVGTFTTTYLGLAMTRGLRGSDIALAVATMLGLMAAAVYAGDETTDVRLVIAIELVLAALGVGFRTLARRRWLGLDWMLCKPEMRGRAPA